MGQVNPWVGLNRVEFGLDGTKLNFYIFTFLIYYYYAQ